MNGSGAACPKEEKQVVRMSRQVAVLRITIDNSAVDAIRRQCNVRARDSGVCGFNECTDAQKGGFVGRAESLLDSRSLPVQVPVRCSTDEILTS